MSLAHAGLLLDKSHRARVVCVGQLLWCPPQRICGCGVRSVSTRCVPGCSGVWPSGSIRHRRRGTAVAPEISVERDFMSHALRGWTVVFGKADEAGFMLAMWLSV